MPSFSSQKSSNQLAAVAILFACIVSCLAIFYGVTHLKLSWDDGVITAAFARTLAHTGHLSLTPASTPVEGTSSLAWTAILMPPAWLSPNPWNIVIWMKCCAGLCFLGSLLLLYRLGLRLLGDRTQAITATLLFAFCITPAVETFNGMEMNFLALLALTLTLVLTQDEERLADTLAATVLTALILLTRWESPALLAFLLYGIWAYTRRTRQIATVAVAIVVAFLLFSLWRYSEFHEWLPNTIYAKRWSPYQSVPGLRSHLASRAKAIAELFIVLGWPIVLAAGCGAVLLIRRSSRSHQPSTPHGAPVFASVTLGAILLSLALGQNWGHPGRMVLGYLPFLILLCVFAVYRVAGTSARHRLVAAALLLVGQFCCWTAEAHQNTQQPSIAPVVRLEGEGKLAESVRLALGKQQLNLLTPDVGATALCCERVDIFDAGLLTSPYLAQHGWSGFPAYFRQTNPDMVITHMFWALNSGIYNLPEFADYGMIGGYGFRAYVRKDLYQQLLQHGMHEVPVAGVPDCADPPNVKKLPIDQQFAQKKQRCIDFNPVAHPDVQATVAPEANSAASLFPIHR